MNKVEKLIRPDILALSAYHVADASGLLKLDAMENPYQWPEEMVNDWLETLREVELNRYPDPAGRALCQSLREVMKVPEGQDILLGNGSDEIIQIMAMAMARPGAKIMAFEPGFVMYKMIAQFAGLEYIGIPLKEGDFSIDLTTALAQIREHQPELLFIAYPNNPTANAFNPMVIDALVEAAEGLVVIDEAYQPFAEDTFMGRLGQHDNLLVMRTVSKLGLAGLRLGFLAGAPEWIEQFDKVRLPYNINVLTQASARFAMKYHTVFEEQAAKIRLERHRLFNCLQQIEGIEPFPSRANFILFRAPLGRSGQIFEALKEQGVLIKNMGAASGPLANCLRVTVGTESQNEAFLEALHKALR